MQILESMGIKYAKPAARVNDKKPASNSALPERHNADKVQLAAPSVMLRESGEAMNFTQALKEKMLDSPAAAAKAHTADYRLMDAMRSQDNG